MFWDDERKLENLNGEQTQGRNNMTVGNRTRTSANTVRRFRPFKDKLTLSAMVFTYSPHLK